jgi:NagD protein
LSGEATAADAAAYSQSPDLIVADIGELGEQIERARLSRNRGESNNLI